MDGHHALQDVGISTEIGGAGEERKNAIERHSQGQPFSDEFSDPRNASVFQKFQGGSGICADDRLDSVPGDERNIVIFRIFRMTDETRREAGAVFKG